VTITGKEGRTFSGGLRPAEVADFPALVAGPLLLDSERFADARLAVSASSIDPIAPPISI
jgi:hypothetical protein